MGKRIVVLDGIRKSNDELRAVLKSLHYPSFAIQSLPHLEDLIQIDEDTAVIIDIDSVPVDNRTLRNLASTYPDVRFLCTSKDRFHPDLKDAIRNHFYACLTKPVDPDELLYWIKSIFEEKNIPDT